MPSLGGRESSEVLAGSSLRPYVVSWGILLQVGPSLVDIDGEFRGGGFVEEVEENEGGGASVE